MNNSLVLIAIFIGVLYGLHTFDEHIPDNDKLMYVIKNIGKFPDVMDVEFGSISVTNGIVLSKEATKYEPGVHVSMENDSYYAIMMVTPDAPTSESPVYSPMINWYICNITVNNTSGNVVVPYTPPISIIGMQNYLLLLFEQVNGAISVSEISPIRFALSKHCHKHNLSLEGAIHFSLKSSAATQTYPRYSEGSKESNSHFDKMIPQQHNVQETVHDGVLLKVWPSIYRLERMKNQSNNEPLSRRNTFRSISKKVKGKSIRQYPNSIIEECTCTQQHAKNQLK